MSASLIDLLGEELRALFEPVERVVSDPSTTKALLAALGAPTAASAGGAALASTLGAVNDLRVEIAQLAANPSPSFEGIARLLDASSRAFTAVRALADPGGPAAALPGFGTDLADLLLATYLRRRHLLAFRIAALLGLITEADEVPAQAVVQNGTLVRNPFRLDRFRAARLSDLLRDPEAALRAEYGGTPATVADANALCDRLFPRVARLLECFGIATRYGMRPDERELLGDAAAMMDHALLVYVEQAIAGAQADAGALFAISSADRGNLGLVVSPFGAIAIQRKVRGWDVALALTAAVQGFAIGPQGVTLMADAGVESVDGKFSATLAAPADGGPAFVLGARDGTRLEVGGAALGAELSLSQARRALALSAAVSSAALVVEPGDGDGFVRRVIPRTLRVGFDLGLDWSNEHGLAVRGGAALDATLPVAFTLGPISVQAVHVTAHGDASGIGAELSLDGALALGPVRAVVSRVGIAAKGTFPSGGGNLGPVDVALAFKSPDGVGLSIDGAVVSGGGFVAHVGDEYQGALQLSVCGISVKAYGLVETKLPGGADGYSFLVVLSTEFSPGVQLPFGFTLDGVGGLLGVHRTMALDHVESALWSHHFDGLLFPKDPVAAAPTLMSSLDSFFPAADGRYLFGPLAKIGWGEGLVEAVVGLFIEVPEPVKLLLLGEVTVLVPHTLPQVELHIDFAGGVDFGKKLAFFDASLHDSRIERFVLTGDLAFRWGWGDPSIFALAIGGFHPHFQPPTNFPALRRVSILIGVDVAQIVAQAYFALTSNTLQFGAHIELTAGIGDFNVHGWLGLDALCQWAPFSFTFDLSGGIDLRAGTTVLASVHLDGQLSGPTPWHISGDASLSLLFFDVSVHFDKSWGNQTPSLPPVDPTPVLRAALADRTAFSSTSTTKAVVAVQSHPSDAHDAVLLDPSGALRIAQRVVPLGQSITRFGGTPLATPRTFSIDALNVLGTSASGTPTNEEFAVAQFEDLSDAEKLSLPSFTRLSAGVEVGADRVDLGTSPRSRAVPTKLSYDTKIFDSIAPMRPGGAYTLGADVLAAMNARFQPPVKAPPRITLAAEQYVIAGVDDLTLRNDLASDGSKRGALRALAAYLDHNPSVRGQLQVVLAQEAA